MTNKLRTFPDAGVLIAAARGQGRSALKALQILDDPDREFVSSAYLRLEVLPKALYYRREEEARLYVGYFSRVSVWVETSELLIEDAYRQAREWGLSTLDALHVTAAMAVGVDEFITTEKPGKPLYRVPGLPIVSLL